MSLDTVSAWLGPIGGVVGILSFVVSVVIGIKNDRRAKRLDVQQERNQRHSQELQVIRKAAEVKQELYQNIQMLDMKINESAKAASAMLPDSKYLIPMVAHIQRLIEMKSCTVSDMSGIDYRYSDPSNRTADDLTVLEELKGKVIDNRIELETMTVKKFAGIKVL